MYRNQKKGSKRRAWTQVLTISFPTIRFLPLAMRTSFGYGTWRQGADSDGLAKSWSLLDCQWWLAIEAIWEPKVVWHKWKVIILQRHPVTFSISFQALADQRCHACLIRSRLPSFGDRWKGAEVVFFISADFLLDVLVFCPGTVSLLFASRSWNLSFGRYLRHFGDKICTLDAICIYLQHSETWISCLQLNCNILELKSVLFARLIFRYVQQL